MKSQYDGVYEHAAWLIKKRGGFEKMAQTDIVTAIVEAVRCYDKNQKVLNKSCDCGKGDF